MFWWVVAIVAALVFGQMATLRFQYRYRHFDKAALAVQALATSAAILVAGYWYVYERKGLPHADTRLDVVGVKVAPGIVALESRFTFTNLGATLLKVGDLDVRLQQMDVGSLPAARLLRLPRTAFPDRLDGKDVYDDGVLMWPTIRWFRGGKPRAVEPGETDLRVIDMMASCTDTALRVLFQMRRPGTDHVWSDQVSVGLSRLCAMPIGGREVWSNAEPDK